MRVSTETQAEKGYGLQEQKDLIEEYCHKNGLILKGLYVDEAKSGAKYDLQADDLDDALIHREQLLNLLDAIQPGEKIIVRHTNRLWRSDGPQFYIMRELKRKKADILSIDQPGYTLYEDNPTNKFINTMLDAIDILDRDQTVIKLSRGRSTKAKSGNKPAGNLPYGYKYSDDKKSVILDEKEASVVKKIFSLAQKGKTASQIADVLNNDGIKAKRGGRWTRYTVLYMLKNDFYMGILTHQGNKIKGNQEPLISKIQFGKVRAQLDRRHH